MDFTLLGKRIPDSGSLQSPEVGLWLRECRPSVGGVVGRASLAPWAPTQHSSGSCPCGCQSHPYSEHGLSPLFKDSLSLAPSRSCSTHVLFLADSALKDLRHSLPRPLSPTGRLPCRFEAVPRKQGPWAQPLPQSLLYTLPRALGTARRPLLPSGPSIGLQLPSPSPRSGSPVCKRHPLTHH